MENSTTVTVSKSSKKFTRPDREQQTSSNQLLPFRKVAFKVKIELCKRFFSVVAFRTLRSIP